MIAFTLLRSIIEKTLKFIMAIREMASPRSWRVAEAYTELKTGMLLQNNFFKVDTI